MSEATTPLMQQYNAVKARYPHALLLFRLGDFYELFYEDAMIASRELRITLTSRNREKGQPIPMCGVPYHAAESYIARLIRAGFKVAICEQMEQPGPGKKLVRREVSRVITPGTATDVAVLDARENNFLAAVAQNTAHATIGLALVDLSTGEFQATEFSGAGAEELLRDELQLVRPRETLLARPQQLFETAKNTLLDGTGGVETRLEDWVFQRDYAERILREQFGVAELTGFGLTAHTLAMCAAGAVIHYLRENAARGDDAPSVEALQHLDRIRFYRQHDAMVLDPVSVRNLELLAPIFAEETKGSGPATLIGALDATVTGMGARLMRSWILRPLIDLDAIEARLGAVAHLLQQTVVRGEIRKELRGIQDLERLTSRITLGQALPRELLALRKSLAQLPVLRDYIEVSKPNLHLAPSDYERKQTLVNAERFTSPELKDYERKILAADERILEIERQLFVDVRSSIAAKASRLRRTAAAIAKVDVLASFAKLAADRNYTRPEFAATGELLIIGGRHPVIEELL